MSRWRTTSPSAFRTLRETNPSSSSERGIFTNPSGRLSLKSPVQSTAGTPPSIVTLNVRVSESRTRDGSAGGRSSSVTSPHVGDAMKANTRSGTTPSRKRSLVVMRMFDDVPKFGS